MNNLVKDLQDVFIARVKNMLLLNFVIAWAIVNYEIVMYVLFDDMSIDNKVLYLRHITIGLKEGFVYPLLMTAFYIYCIPLLNLLFVIPYNKYVDKIIKDHKNEMIIVHYERQEEVERIRLEKTEFLKDTMKIELEKKELQLQEDKNKALEKENDLKIEEIELQNKKNESLEKENALKAKEIELKKSEEVLLGRESIKLQKEIDNKKEEIKKLTERISNLSSVDSSLYNKTISSLTPEQIAKINMKNLLPSGETSKYEELAKLYLDGTISSNLKNASFDLSDTYNSFKDVGFDLEDKSKKNSKKS